VSSDAIKDIISLCEDFCNQRIINSETEDIILVGSWVNGTAKHNSDIDLVVVKHNQNPVIQNEKIIFQDKLFDIWFHDLNYMHSTLNKNIEQLSDIYQISLYLSFLRNCTIIHTKQNLIRKYIEQAEKWSWNPEDKKYLDMKAAIPSSGWAKKAYQENLKLLDLAKLQFEQSNPISHRLKDYPELISEAEKNKVELLFKITLRIFNKIGVERELTELSDARKALIEENWNLAFASIKDVLRFLIRKSVRSAPLELRNPILWRLAESSDLDEDLLKALRAAYL